MGLTLTELVGGIWPAEMLIETTSFRRVISAWKVAASKAHA